MKQCEFKCKNAHRQHFSLRISSPKWKHDNGYDGLVLNHAAPTHVDAPLAFAQQPALSLNQRQSAFLVQPDPAFSFEDLIQQQQRQYAMPPPSPHQPNGQPMSNQASPIASPQVPSQNLSRGQPEPPSPSATVPPNSASSSLPPSSAISVTSPTTSSSSNDAASVPATNANGSQSSSGAPAKKKHVCPTCHDSPARAK